MTIYDGRLAECIVASAMIFGLAIMGYNGCNNQYSKENTSIKQSAPKSLDKILLPHYQQFNAAEVLGYDGKKGNKYKCLKKAE